MECFFQSTFQAYSWMSIINELDFFKDLESLSWGWVEGGGLGSPGRGSSVMAGEERMKPTAVAMAACH